MKPSRNHQLERTRPGFTLVELTLAMAFLAVLLITITILVIRIIGIYQSGISIRAISSTGRQLIDDFSRSISGSPIVDVSYIPAIDLPANGLLDKNDRLTYKYYYQKTASIDISGVTRDDTPVAGVFCTGLYTYLWNTPYAFQDPDRPEGIGYTYTYYDADDTPITLTDFRLLRIPDSARDLCTGVQHQDESRNINPDHSDFTAPETQKTSEPVELLSDTEDALGIYDLRIFPASSNRVTGHIFYSGTFILATLRGGVDIFTNGDYCTAPVSDTLNTDFNYCAINKFNFAMRATGETKGEDMYGTREAD